MRGTRRLPPVACALALLAGPADAHLVTTGLGPVYDGIGHLLVSPDDLLGVLAVAMLAGLGGSRCGRPALFLLPSAWLFGGLLGLHAARVPAPAFASTASLVAVGALVAADRRLSPVAVASVAGAVGLLHGLLNGGAMSGGGFLALVGVGAAVFTLVSLAAGLVVSLRPAWTRIAVRVAGSWIAAIGMLMLGWAAKGAA